MLEEGVELDGVSVHGSAAQPLGYLSLQQLPASIFVLLLDLARFSYGKSSPIYLTFNILNESKASACFMNVLRKCALISVSISI